MEDTLDTRLEQAVAERAQRHPGLSGIVPIADGRDAFAVRALLIEAADRSIDLQYYIWRDDLSGTLLFEALQRAADRGVRVRLLLDDNRTSGMDEKLSVLDAHPLIEVRLFNPFRFRTWRVFDYARDFSRLNRRMHNKAFIVDDQIAVIGGRNIGDEYFGANQEAVMYDLDVLAIGEVVRDVSCDFDRYWTSDSSFPAERLLAGVDSQVVARLRAAAVQLENGPSAVAYMQAVREQPFVRLLLARELPFEWAKTYLVSDDPSKIAGKTQGPMLWPHVQALLREPRQEVQLVSPYFVPRAQGVEFLVETARAGVDVRLLTNSLEATDVAPVHAGYAKWRKRLLEGGVRLFELKRDLSASVPSGAGHFGSSASSLHAKTFAVDRSRVFIGSFNFDPRSAHLNTENGFIIESPAIAGRLHTIFETKIPQMSYEVRLGPSGKLQWIERNGGQVHDTEPGVSRGRQAMVALLSHLPIDWLL